jgi:hypothetical protein
MVQLWRMDGTNASHYGVTLALLVMLTEICAGQRCFGMAPDGGRGSACQLGAAGHP